MTNEAVFNTGGTGHIGFRTIVLALQAGYNIPRPSSKLAFRIVPDFTTEKAFDEAVIGVDYITHVALPTPFPGEILPENHHNTFIIPAINATINILKAAHRTPRRHYRIQLLLRSRDAIGYRMGGETSRVVIPPSPYPQHDQAYFAIKVATLKVTEDFAKDNTLTFDVVNIAVACVLGRNELVTDVKAIRFGSNGPLVAIMHGNRSTVGVPLSTVHVNDVALMHVNALDSWIPAGLYIAHSRAVAGTREGDVGRNIGER